MNQVDALYENNVTPRFIFNPQTNTFATYENQPWGTFLEPFWSNREAREWMKKNDLNHVCMEHPNGCVILIWNDLHTKKYYQYAKGLKTSAFGKLREV